MQNSTGSDTPFPILYQDDDLVVVDKPSGMLVHATPLAPGVKETCMYFLRKKLRKRVYPAHRLDRGTSGVLIFATDKPTAQKLGIAFQDRQISKTYLAVVRGYVDGVGVVDHPLREDECKDAVPAVTRFERLSQIEVPFAIGRYPQSRYSLIRLFPETGRQHQLRKHMHHISHPIIGDSNYGDLKHNRFFRERLGIARMLLFAERLAFKHPWSGEQVTVEAARPLEFNLETLSERLQKFA